MAKAWRARSLAAESAGLIRESRWQEAADKAQAAYHLAPDEPSALRAVAHLYTQSRDGRGLAFLRRLVALPGATRDDRLNAVRQGLQLGDLPLAQEQLAVLGRGEPSDGEVLKLEVQLALQRRDRAAALTLTGRLLAEQPKDAFARFTRAQLLLLAPAPAAPATTDVADIVEIEAAREDMRSAAAREPSLRPAALRLLIADARQRGAHQESITLADELIAAAESRFQDELLRLDVLEAANSDRLNDALAQALKSAAGKPENAFEMGKWLLSHGRAKPLLEWVESLPAAIREEELFKLVRVDAHAALRDWSAAEALLTGPSWAKAELIRRASLARAFREQGRTLEFQREWSSVLAESRSRKDNLQALLHLVTTWSWSAEREQVLWAIMERHPEERWAAALLSNAYLKASDSTGLRKVAEHLYAREPNNAAYKNNVAILSLLQSVHKERASRLAKEAHESDPRNPLFACTYAYALHLNGQNEVALALMEKLRAEDLNNPSTAGYFALILDRAGDTSRAEQYGQIALTGQPLPEERANLSRLKILHPKN